MTQPAGTQIGSNGRRVPVGELPEIPALAAELYPVHGDPAHGAVPAWNAGTERVEWAPTTVESAIFIWDPAQGFGAGNLPTATFDGDVPVVAYPAPVDVASVDGAGVITLHRAGVWACICLVEWNDSADLDGARYCSLGFADSGIADVRKPAGFVGGDLDGVGTTVPLNATGKCSEGGSVSVALFQDSGATLVPRVTMRLDLIIPERA